VLWEAKAPRSPQGKWDIINLYLPRKIKSLLIITVLKKKKLVKNSLNSQADDLNPNIIAHTTFWSSFLEVIGYT